MIKSSTWGHVDLDYILIQFADNQSNYGAVRVIYATSFEGGHMTGDLVDLL